MSATPQTHGSKESKMNAIATEPTIDLASIIKDLLEEHAEVPAAADALELRCNDDPALYRTVVNGHMKNLCRLVVSAVIRAERSAIWNGQRKIETSVSALPSAEDMSVAVSRSLMDFPLLGGSRKLGDCSRAHLVIAENGYNTQAQDMLIKSRWLRLIRAALPDDNTTVRQALSDDKLQALKAEALNMREAA